MTIINNSAKQLFVSVYRDKIIKIK